MLPVNLVELIHSGKAQYKTWTTGGTGSSRLPVPKNNYVVIVSFLYSHFIDVKKQSMTPKEKLKELYENVVHGLQFKSQANEYYYCMRSSFHVNHVDANDILISTNQSDTKLECYQVHKTDVHIDIWRMRDVSQWATSMGKLADDTAEYPNPVGYGTVNNPPNADVVREILFDGVNDQFLPYQLQQGLPIQPGYKEQFRNDIKTATQLNTPSNNQTDAHYNYPIVNIGYVLVNSPFDKNTK